MLTRMFHRRPGADPVETRAPGEAARRPLLAFDTGSTIVSVAVGVPGGIDVLSAPQGRSSRELIAMIDELLARVGAEPRDLAGIAAARGPGSFTGLRVGLATALGLRQATGVPATAASTFEILAAHYVERTDPNRGGSARQPGGTTAGAVPAEIVAVVDAHRERWFAQRLRLEAGGRVEGAGPPEISAHAALEHSPLPLVGHGASRIAGVPGSVEASELAPTLLRQMADSDFTWCETSLTEPLYLRSPATGASARLPGTPRPKRRRRRRDSP